MAARRYTRSLRTSLAAAALAVVSYLGLQYGALLRDMDRAAVLYSQGDLEASLRTYEEIEQRLRAHGALRLIPATDRQTLLLNQARLLYALKRHDEATERLAREDEISGIATDARFFLLRGNITYQRARLAYDEANKVDLNTLNLALNVLQDGLAAAEESYRESLQLNPNDWDAKYNLEFMHNMRRAAGPTSKERVNMLEQQRAPEVQLPPDLVG